MSRSNVWCIAVNTRGSALPSPANMGIRGGATKNLESKIGGLEKIYDEQGRVEV